MNIIEILIMLFIIYSMVHDKNNMLVSYKNCYYY